MDDDEPDDSEVGGCASAVSLWKLRVKRVHQAIRVEIDLSVGVGQQAIWFGLRKSTAIAPVYKTIGEEQLSAKTVGPWLIRKPPQSSGGKNTSATGECVCREIGLERQFSLRVQASSLNCCSNRAHFRIENYLHGNGGQNGLQATLVVEGMHKCPLPKQR